jgi:hypothetical protein
MGTRSRIAVMHGDNCKSIYCHWDGYLEYNGSILQKHYDSAKANNLVALGDLSSLKPEIGEAHPFSKFGLKEEDPDFNEMMALYEKAEALGWCTFYQRDRGEKNVEFQTDTDFDAFIERVQGCCAEWYYIMRDGVWYVGNIYSSDERFYKKLVPLAEALASLPEDAVA